MTSYKICISTSKRSGKIIAGITHIVETDEEPVDYSIENERYWFDYKFFPSELQANEYLQNILK